MEDGTALEVCVGMGVEVDTAVCVGTGVKVKGRAVSVSGSVRKGVAVNSVPGAGVKDGVRVATFGTQRVSPVLMRS